MHTSRVQLEYSRCQSASLLTCLLHGQGFCLDGNRTGSTLKANRVQKELRLTGMTSIAQGEELSSVDKLPQGKSPQDHGALALGQLGMIILEIPSWLRYEIGRNIPFVYFFLCNQLNAVETLQCNFL